jgi:hypothetical protein
MSLILTPFRIVGSILSALVKVVKGILLALGLVAKVVFWTICALLLSVLAVMVFEVLTSLTFNDAYLRYHHSLATAGKVATAVLFIAAVPIVSWGNAEVPKSYDGLNFKFGDYFSGPMRYVGGLALVACAAAVVFDVGVFAHWWVK